jgi:hypothetical protein
MIEENKFIMHLKVDLKILFVKTHFFLLRESDICQRLYCPKNRRFDLHIVDSTNQVYLT